MNILFVDQYGDLGGAQNCLLDLLPAVQERNWGAVVAAPGGGTLERRVRALGIDFMAIRCGPLSSGRKTLADGVRFALQTPRLVAQLRRLAQQLPAGLVYVNGPRLLPAAVGVSAPLLFHCHSRVGGRGAVGVVRAALAVSRAAVVGSCRYVLEPLATARSTHVVYNGVAASPCPPRPHEGFAIGVIGRISPEKGQREFVTAARELWRRYPGCRFVVAGAALFGDPAAAHYEAEVRALADGFPINFLGWRENVYEVLAGLDLLVVPSIAAEATTRVILEAFAARVPVLASATGGIPEVVRDGVTGRLTPPGDTTALVGAMEETLRDEPRARAMAQQAHAEWAERFTLERYRREMLAIVERAGQGAR